MRDRIGNTFMLIGTGLILAALCLYVFNLNEARRAGRYADEIQKQLQRISDTGGMRTGSQNGDSQALEAEQASISDMAEAEIDGFRYIGYLTLPALGLKLPVMDDWDYKRLKLAPCRYYGSPQTNDLVVAAHNYDRHLGRLGKLLPGDPVYFTDMTGQVFSYEVGEVTVLDPMAVEEMTDGSYALTLFTCTYGGKSRVTVRCLLSGYL